MHPDNELNELAGDEWLYFTKSLWTTAYPSELGHAARKAHGANKPPRLMARLIEFFSRSGRARARSVRGRRRHPAGRGDLPWRRRALGFELDPRWIEVYESVVRDLSAERDGAGPLLRRPRTIGSGWRSNLRPVALPDAAGRCGPICSTPSRSGSVDFVATDPPYNPQLKLTMAGGRLAESFANRRTDYAMISDDPADLANSASYDEFLERMGLIFGKLRRVLRDGRYAAVIVRDAYQDGRYRFTGADLAGSGGVSRLRAEGRPRSGTRRGRGSGRTGIPARSCPTSSTSTSW